MKTDQEIMNSIRAAIDDCTRGIDEAPSLHYQIARKAKGEEPVVKKLSTSAILVIALVIISMTAALAAGLGLFGELAQNPRGDSRLSEVDKVADPIEREWTTDDGITIRIEQAYYEGNRVFISYRMSGDWTSTVLHEGSPDGEINWDWVEENMIVSQTMISDEPERQQAILQLDGQSQRWIESTEKGLHDGLSLADGTYLDIIGGDNIVQEDGSVIGWKECEIPDDRLEETLTFQAKLYRIHSIMFQDGTTYRQSTERGENTFFEFTLNQNTDLTRLKGSISGPNYTAMAELTAGHIDLRGKITITCPDAWIQVWKTWENPDHIDMIEDWYLYVNGEVISENGVQGVGISGENQLVYEVLFDAMNDLTGISLVPVYQNQQPHMEEAITLGIE